MKLDQINVERVLSTEEQDEEQRTNSIGLWHFAESYRNAANCLIDHECDLRFQASIYYLYVHAIELALKAALRARGMTVRELRRRPYSHDLMELVAACHERRLASRLKLGKRREAILLLLNEISREHEFRYVRTGPTAFPTLDSVRALTTRLLDATRRLCVDEAVRKRRGTA